jgi:hypothetical protein
VKIRVVSQGTGATSRVENAETGEVVEGVVAVEVSLRVNEANRALVEFLDVPVDVIAETEDES